MVKDLHPSVIFQDRNRAIPDVAVELLQCVRRQRVNVIPADSRSGTERCFKNAGQKQRLADIHRFQMKQQIFVMLYVCRKQNVKCCFDDAFCLVSLLKRRFTGSRQAVQFAQQVISDLGQLAAKIAEPKQLVQAGAKSGSGRTV